jgi:4-hydroxy-3-polyprenylbenzoate decarboxylase
MDLRDYIAALKKHGELIEIEEEVDWNLEAAAICTMSNRVGGPAVWFKNIKGYPKGYTLLGSPYAGKRHQCWRRMAIALGLDPDISWNEWGRELAMRYTHPIKPTIVSTGPVKKNKMIGKEVNIFKFPLPYLHNGDGGRYGGTCTTQITKDPDSDWVNWGNYRWMAHTKNKLGGDFQVGQHMPDMYYEYERRGEPMPFCIAIGGDPAIFIASTMAIPKGYSEVDFVGGMRMEPIELVRAETNNLLVPANAEVVIEGEVRPGERWDEGPFGEFDGYMNTPRRPQPVYRITAITWRDDPIWPFIVEGTRFNDSCSAVSANWGPILAKAARANGLPVWNVISLPEASWAWPIWSTEVPDHGYIGECSDFMWSMTTFVWVDKSSITDPDVDLNDSAEFLEDFFCNLRYDRIYRSRENKPMSNIVAWASIDEKLEGYSCNLVYDTSTHPGDEPKQRIKFENVFPEDVQEKVIQKWKELGFEEEFKLKKLEPMFTV